MATKKIVVIGGTGFLGRQICLAGLNSGYKVTAISRSGVPDLNDNVLPLSTLSQIKWAKGDVFDPTTYTSELEDADAVIHSMGTIFNDSGYKSSLNSQSSVCDFARKLPSLVSSALKGANPLEKSNFDRLNRDSAIILAKEFSKVSKERQLPFVYISAHDWNPLVDPRYISSKREAEFALSNISNLRSVFLRPGLMFDKKSDFSHPRNLLGAGLDLGRTVCKELPKPLTTETVASAAIEAIQDDTIEGVVSLEALSDYDSLRTV